jgi:hypothetical protein
MTKRQGLFLGISASLLSCVVTVGAAMAADLSPKETYLKYRPALEKAKKIEDVSSFLCKKVNEEIAHTPAEMRPMMFDMMKAFQPSDVKIVTEDLKGDTAMLTMKCDKTDKNTKETGTGTCTFVKEDGVWKINKEQWNSKVETK